MSKSPELIAVLQERVDRLFDSAPDGRVDPIALRNHNARLRRARLTLARAKGSHTTSEWEAIVAETGGICVRCHYQHDLAKERPSKGYIRPLAGGGSNAKENLMPLCRQCASSKGAEMVNWLSAWRKAKAIDPA